VLGTDKWNRLPEWVVNHPVNGESVNKFKGKLGHALSQGK